MALVTPTGILVDFELVSGTPSSSRGTLWQPEDGHGTTGTVHTGTVGSGGSINFDIGSNSATVDRLNWLPTAGNRNPNIVDERPRDNQGLNFLTDFSSLYLWDGSNVYEFDVGDANSQRPESLNWIVTPRPAGIGNGTNMRFIIADDDQATVVSNFVQGLETPDAAFTSSVTGLTVAFTDASTGGTPTSWLWSFGDGTTSTQQNPSHTYASAASFTVTLTATNSVGGTTATATVTTVTSDLMPTAPNVGTQTANFGQAFSTTLPVGTGGDPPLTYAIGPRPGWVSFNTGTRVLSGTPDTVGSTTLTYTVTDSDGDSDSDTFTLAVNAVVPEAPTGLVATPGDGTLMLVWQQNGDGGSPLTAQRVRYQRAGQSAVFLDVTTTATSVLLTGLDNGFVYDMRVLVINSQGRTDSATIMATPSSQTQPPVASFTSAVTNLAVQFTDTSTGAPASWAWDFGDGNTSTDQSPSHTYANANTFTVMLTATNVGGSDTASAQVTVSAADLMPTAPTVPNQSGKVNDAFSATLPVGTGGDPPLTYAVSGQPSWASFDTGTRVLSGTPNAASTTTVTYTVTDDDGDSDDTTFTISIVADRMPTAPTVGAQTGTTGLAFSVTLPVGTGGDPPLAYSVSGEPSWSSFNTTTRVLSGTPNAVASTTVTYTVTDNDGDAASTTFTVTVAAAGSMPTGLLADFTLTVTSFGGSSRVNGTWAGDRLVEFSNGETICVQRFFWDTSGVERKPLFADEDNTVWDDWDDNVAEMQGNSFYIWDGSNVNEAAVSDRIDVNDDSMNWNQFDRPSSVVIGSVLRFIYATSGQSAVVSNFVQLPDPPVASFTSAVTSLTVAFTDTSTNTPTSWAWDFGDSATSTQQNPSHTYGSAGTRTVTLIATNTGGSDSASAQVTTTAPDTQPTAPAVADQSGTVGTSFSVTLPVGTGGNAPLTYSVTGAPSWASFNTGTRVLSGTPDAAATTTITYTVTDNDGDADSTTFAIVVSATGSMPTGVLADFSITVTVAPSGNEIGFLWHPNLNIGTLSSGSDITIDLANSTDIVLDEFAWDDNASPDPNRRPGLHRSAGSFTAASAELAGHSFYLWDGNSVYEARFDAGTDVRADRIGWNSVARPSGISVGDVVRGIVADAGQSTVIRNFVQMAPPVASFTSAVTDLTVQFTDTSTNTPTSWLWDFGDGNSSTDQNPSHTYASAGTRTVTLTATNADGSDSATAQVTVAAADPMPTLAAVADQAGQTGVLFNVTLPAATGGDPPVTYAVSGRPAWLAFNTGTRVLSGTPTAAATSTLTYTATDDDGDAATRMFDVIITATPPPAPDASFTHVVSDLAVAFTDTSTNTPTGWAWTFGDGGTSSQQSPSHTYASAGTRTVTLTATNTGGSDTFTASVTTSAPPPSAPVAAFTSAVNNLRVVFTDTSTGAPISWLWSFGDGATSTQQSPSHTYASAGTRTVTLTATNTGGSDSASAQVTVAALAPVASFTHTVSNLRVRFTDTSSNTPTGWAWTFGDGVTSTQQNPSHTYASAGTYTVTLTATNTGGSDSATAQATTTDPPPVTSLSAAYAASAGAVAGRREALWLEALDAAGNVFDAAPVTSVSVQDTLDQTGSVQVALPATARRTLERAASLALRDSNGEMLRHCFITDMTRGRTPGSDSLSLTAFDDLAELQRVSTLPGAFLNTSGMTAVQTIEQLCRLAGWGSNPVNAVDRVAALDLSATSVLSAVQDVCDATGMHFRLGLGQRVLEFGQLGESVAELPLDARLSDSRVVNRNEIANWIVPFAGDTRYAVTLRNTTRRDPYPVERIARGARTGLAYPAWAMYDEASIARYGRIEASPEPDLLFNLTSGVDGVELSRVADSLYDWAAAWLARNAVAITHRSARFAGSNQRLRIGDKVTLPDTGEQHFIVGITRNWTLSSIETTVELSNVNERLITAEQVLARRLLRRQAVIPRQVDLTLARDSDEMLITNSSDVLELIVNLPDGTFDIAQASLIIERFDVNAPASVRVSIDGRDIGVSIFDGPLAGLLFENEIDELVSANGGDHFIRISAGNATGNLAALATVTAATLV